jgi:6-phosphogluconate dehydrogenase
MGMNLSRNLAHKGFGVSVYNRTTSRVDDFMRQYSKEGAFTPAHSPQELVAQLDKPRRILIMVKAGPPIDETIEHLAPYLEKGDILIDGGNSYFLDTVRRGKELEARGLRFIGTGVSGGEEGALNGPSIMPGGARDAYEQVEAMLTRISAHVDGEPCCTYIGPGGAGHYVKMVHNGIEYSMLQAYAEGFDILDSCQFDLDLHAIAHLWNQGSVVRSWLLELAERAFDRDPKLSRIRGYVEDSGEGRWTLEQAIDLRVPAPALAMSLFARFDSRRDDSFGNKVIAALRNEFGGHAVKAEEAAAGDGVKAAP